MGRIRKEEPVDKVVTLGGGGGHSQVLKAAAPLPNVRITAVVPHTDSGGSTGLLTEEYDVLGYLGDLTKCMCALSRDKEIAAGLMHRFADGSLKSHSAKNVLFLALLEEHGLDTALTVMRRVCGLEKSGHRVLPVSRTSTILCAELQIGNEVVSEKNIDQIAGNPLWHPDAHAINRIYFNPPVSVADDAAEAVREADWIIVSPGDLYSSVLPIFLADGMTEAVCESSARVVMILNIMTKRGETDQYTAEDFIRRVEDQMARSCDIVLANTAPIPPEQEAQYLLEQKVEMPEPVADADHRVIGKPLLTVTQKGELYHDVGLLRHELAEIMKGKG